MEKSRSFVGTDKRTAGRFVQEAVWAKIQKHRSSVRAAHKPFSDNRSFSANVRELVKRGKVEEARQMCAQQVPGLHHPEKEAACFSESGLVLVALTSMLFSSGPL